MVVFFFPDDFLPWVTQARADRDDSLPLCLIKFVLNCFLALRVTARGERGGRSATVGKEISRTRKSAWHFRFIFIYPLITAAAAAATACWNGNDGRTDGRPFVQCKKENSN